MLITALFNLCLVIGLAICLAKLCKRINLPPLLGFLLTGIIVGQYTRSIIDPMLPDWLTSWVSLPTYIFEPIGITQWPFSNFKLFSLSYAAVVRKIALIIILTRAGLGIDRRALIRIGHPALRMSILPGLLEATLVAYISSHFFRLPLMEGLIFGWVISAVSPAVIVPQMLRLKDQGYGQIKQIPTLILASATVDDVIAITMFDISIDLNMDGLTSTAFLLLSIPIKIILGLFVGCGLGYILSLALARQHSRLVCVIMFFVGVVALHLLELEANWPISSLIGIMASGFTVLLLTPYLAQQLSSAFNQSWKVAETALFVLIGAEVDLALVGSAGVSGLAIISIGLIARSLGVSLSLIGSELNWKERIFCQISFLPKATVQAAIGGTAITLVENNTLNLNNGVETGQLILALSVLSIVVTAPLGATAIQHLAPRLLYRRQNYSATTLE